MGQGAERPSGETLKQYSVDLTDLAKRSTLDPVIGRDEEIRRTIQILSRKNKSNPVLLGSPGVGKTAILEGLAQRIVNNDVPESLKNKRLLTIDLASLLAGSGIRGQFEEKFKNLLADIKDAQEQGDNGGVICFIDELHTLLNLGKAEGSMDAGNMIKPALARGLQLVGATTLDEYRKTIEKDQALARRFQPVLVDAPSVEATIAILRGIKTRYESHFGVQISDAALVQAAVLSDRYIPDRYLPDKAIDLLDEAASALKLSQESKPVSLETLDREITTLQIERESLKAETSTYSVDRLKTVNDAIQSKREEQQRLTNIWEQERSRVGEIKDVKRQIDDAVNKLEVAQREGNYETASRLRYLTIPALKAKLPSETETDEVDNNDMLIRDRLTTSDIARVISKSTGIPLENLRQGEMEKLLHIEDALRQKIVSQDEAIAAVAKAVRLSRAGLQAPNRPLASFLMLGPSGVGKTSLTKAMAALLFGDAQRGLIQINMSELSSKHDVSRLLGATPGYVGYEEGGQLTNAVKRKPYAVVVLDEIEKAHPEVQNILLQILEEGELTDGQGAKVSFKNTIVCMTSNLGASEFVKIGASKKGVVTDKTKEAVMQYVTAWFRPEVLGRLDDIVIFNNLPRDAVNNIVKLRLAELQERLDDRRIKLRVSPEAIDLLAHAGYSEQYGARAVARVIRDKVVAKVTTALLEGRIRNGDEVQVSTSDQEIVIQNNHERELSTSATVQEEPKYGFQESPTARSLPILASEVESHKWAASVDGSTIRIDSETTPGTLNMPTNWLRDRCECASCIQPSTGQRLHKSSDVFVPDASPKYVDIIRSEGVTQLEVEWEGIQAMAGYIQHPKSIYSLRRLVEQQDDAKYTKQDPTFVPISRWNHGEIIASPTLRIAYEDIKASPAALQAALLQVVSYGLVVLTGVPTDQTDDATCELRKVMQLVGELRNTFYGPTWDVKAIQNSKNIAYTDVDLGFHQDLLYFESPPRFQALHCLRNQVQGGSSYFVDAFAAAAVLKQDEPRMYDVLKRTLVPFHYDNDGKWYQRWHPTFEETSDGKSLHAINYSPPFQGPLPLINRASTLGLPGGAADDLPAALLAFDNLLHRDTARYEFTMQPGDLVFFDNRRVLHARRAFQERVGTNVAPGEASRWLKGCYLDGDVVWNKLRYLTKQVSNNKFNPDDRWQSTLEEVIGERDEKAAMYR